MSEEVGDGKVTESKVDAKSVLALIDSAIFKVLGKVISIIVVPVGLFFLYHAWDALEQHGKDLSGIQVTLSDIKGQISELKTGLGGKVDQIAKDEHDDQTDIAVLKSEVERPSPPLQMAPSQEPQVQPEPERHFHRQSDNSPPLVRAIEHSFKQIGRALSPPASHHGR